MSPAAPQGSPAPVGGQRAAGPRRPDPTPTASSAPFWAATAEHVLRIQRCSACGHAIVHPRLRCPRCWADALRWQDASGRGVVASCSVVHRPGHPAFAADAPYVVALVDLAEGPRLLSNVVGCAPADVRVGMDVEVTWQRRGDFTLPLFTPPRPRQRPAARVGP